MVAFPSRQRQRAKQAATNLKFPFASAALDVSRWAGPLAAFQKKMQPPQRPSAARFELNGRPRAHRGIFWPTAAHKTMVDFLFR